MKKINRGFTLIELMIALAIVAILAGVAIPSFNQMMDRRTMVSQTKLFNISVNFARGEASERLLPVVLCSSSDGQTCSGSFDWSNGWIVFVDRDDNQAPDLGTGQCEDTEDCMVKIQLPLPRNVTLNGDVSLLAYNSEGESSVGGTATFNVCGEDALAGDVDLTRSVAFNSVGRASLTKGAAICP